MKTPRTTYPAIQTAYIIAHSTTLFIAALLSPFAIGLIITSARAAGAQIYSPIGILPEIIAAALLLHLILRIVAPKELRRTQKFVKAPGGRPVLAIFTILSALVVAVLTVALFATVVMNIQAMYYMGIGNVLLNIIFVGSMLAIALALTHYYANYLVARAPSRRSASDWFFDQVETVIYKTRNVFSK